MRPRQIEIEIYVRAAATPHLLFSHSERQNFECAARVPKCVLLTIQLIILHNKVILQKKQRQTLTDGAVCVRLRLAGM